MVVHYLLAIKNQNKILSLYHHHILCMSKVPITLPNQSLYLLKSCFVKKSLKRILLTITLSIILVGITEHAFAQSDEKFVFFETKSGNFIIGFFPNDAPQHVENFIKLVESGYYDGTLFHRIIPGFMIQGGDPNTIDGNPNTWGQGGHDDALTAEFNSIKHNRGIVSMARSADPDSAGSQFFIVHHNSNFLDGAYTAFGRIVTEASLVTLDKIASHSTDDDDRPLNLGAVRIIKASVIYKQDISDMLILSDPERTEIPETPASPQKYFNQENNYTSKIPKGWLQEPEGSSADEFDRFVVDRPVVDLPVLDITEILETPDGSQKYENVENNYTFEIPKGWLQESDENIVDENYVIIVGPQTSFFSPVISVETTHTNVKSFEELLDQYLVLVRHLSTSDTFNIISHYETNVNGKRAYQIDYTELYDENTPNLVVQSRTVKIFEQNNVHTISYLNTPDDFDTHLDEFNTALDSFVFLSEPNVSNIPVLSNPKRTEILETPDGSQKYLNLENNYTFEIPKGWLQESEGNFAEDVIIVGPQTSFHPPVISVETTPTNGESFKESLDQYLYSLNHLSTSDTFNIISHSEIDVNGIRAYQIVATESYDENNPNLVVQFREVIIFTQNNEYTFYYESNPDDFDTHLDEFNLVLDSFTLLSEQDVSDMLSHSNLDLTKISIGSQKYENVEKNYAFVSPEGWLVEDFEGWLDADYAQARISVNEYDVIIVGPETNSFTPLISIATEPTNGKTFEQFFYANTTILSHLSTSDTFNIISHYETDVKGIHAYQIDAVIHDEHDPNLVLQSREVIIFTLNNAYSFSYYNVPDIFDIHLDKFNAILDSFTLLSKPGVSDTLDFSGLDLTKISIGSQKYENVENNYAFEIPKGWLQESEENIVDGSDVIIVGPQTSFFPPVISVETTHTNVKSFEELLDKYLVFIRHLSTSDSINIISHYETNVNGKRAYQIDYTGLYDENNPNSIVQSRIVKIFEQNNVYSLYYEIVPDDFYIHLDEFNTVLDSFVFLSEPNVSNIPVLSNPKRTEILETPDGSQKYLNLENNYIFEIPKGWLQEPEGNFAEDVIIVGSQTSFFPPVISVETTHTNGKSIEELLDQYLYGIDLLSTSDTYNIISHSEIDVNGKRAYQIDVTESYDENNPNLVVQFRLVTIFTQNNEYDFYYENNPDDFDTHLDEFNTVLDSFVLLSEQDVSDILVLSNPKLTEISVGPQKYENIENNYAIETPMGWIMQKPERASITEFDVKVIGPQISLIPPLILVLTLTPAKSFEEVIDLKIHTYNTLAESDGLTNISHNEIDVNGKRAYQTDAIHSISTGGQTFVLQLRDVTIYTQNNTYSFTYTSTPNNFDTHLDKFNAVLDSFALLSEPEPKGGGGCLIATAAYGSELAPQIQALREIRDGVVLSTESGQSFMSGFNVLYYSFSPQIADWERVNPVFKEIVKIFITPMLSTLSILNHVNIDSEQEMITFGVGIILLNLGMYIGVPAVIIYKTRKLVKINLHL